MGTYLDDFRPVTVQLQTAIAEPRVAGLSAPLQVRSSGTSTRRSAELVRHYKYWNYIALTRVAEFCASQFPVAGIPTGARIGRRPHLSVRQRAHLRASYGHILQSTQDDVQPIPETHPFLALLKNPNEEDTWCEFAFEAFLFWDLTGELYIWCIPSGFGVPARLWVVPSQWVVRHYHADGALKHYEFVPDGDRSRAIEVPPEEVVTHRLKSPRSKLDGYSPLEAAPLWTDTVETIEASRSASMRNGSNPDLIVKLGERYKSPSDDVLERFRERFKRRASGIEHHGDPLLVPPDIQVEKWSMSPREMDYPNSATQARDNELALHGVPPVVAGVSSDYTRATAEAARAVFCQVTANPKLRRWAGVLTKIAQKFDERIVCWFDDCVPEDQEFVLKREQADFEMGAVTPDEIRMARNREPMGEPAYVTGYVGGGRLPLSEDAQPEALPEPAPGSEGAPPPGADEPDESEDDPSDET